MPQPIYVKKPQGRRVRPHAPSALAVALLAALAALPGASLAQGAAPAVEKGKSAVSEGAVELPAVTVTAEKTSAAEQEVPISMTVVSGEDLERSAAKDTIDIVRQAPNVYMTKAGQHSSVAFISIRGVTPFMEAEQPIGFFVDGVHYRNIDMELLDIERVEVLRGPQSTLYGRNTEAGAVNIITRDPEPYGEHSVSLGIGNYDRKTLSGIFGGALGNQDWSYRVALQQFRSDGYFTRKPDGVNDVDKADDFNARFKVRWKPGGDTWDVVATYDGQRYRDGSTNIATLSQIRSDPHTVSSDLIGFNDTDTHSGTLRAVYKAPSFTVTSISAYTTEDKSATYDVDASAFDAMRLRTDVNYSRFTQELRLSSPDGASGPRWVGGLYYFDQTDHNNFDMNMSGLGFGVQSVRTKTDTRNMALFGQATWPMTDTVSLITGLRYDHETKDVDNRQVWVAMGRDFGSRERMTFNARLPKVGLEYKPSSDLLTYATYAKGYKAGGLNNLADPGHELYEPEYTTNYEIGLKHTGLNNRLQTRLALFWIDWTDQQVEELVLSRSNITNAGKSVSRGVELELAWQASRALMLRASGGWNDAHFVRYKDGGNDFAGNRPPNAPAYTYSLGADYMFGNGWYAHADWQGAGKVYFDSANTKKQDSYGLLNMKAGYRFSDFEVAFWIKNALDKVYVTRAFDIGGGTFAGIAGDPRTFGMTLTARW
ncbi:TonB-dependent receptor [Chitinivorax sp. PXF-14]|uniref:TonB-dependent receptor n=1 Tax=Chitinivorax sp. PXF-14 TaxID=3230488 RepID=UPI00346732D0